MIISWLPQLIPEQRASRKRRSVHTHSVSIVSEEIERTVTIESSGSKVEAKIMGRHLTWIGVIVEMYFFSLPLSLSLIQHQSSMFHQSKINSIEQAQRKLGRGNSVKRRYFSRPIFLETTHIYFLLQNMRYIYIYVRFRLAS